jgi:phage/plasmid-associated DNA primase
LPETITAYPGIIQVDLDGLSPQQIAQIREKAAADPYVVAGYTSVSGDGFKLFVRSAANQPLLHRRACFVSCDAQAWFRSDAAELPIAAELQDNTAHGRAQRFVDRFYDVLRYVPRWKRWLVFENHRWNANADGAEIRLLHNTWLPELLAERNKRLDETDCDETLSQKEKDKLAKAIHGWFNSYANIAPGDKVLEVANTFADVVIDTSVVDGREFLLGTPNGYVDLKTGEFFPHSTEHIITKATGFPYDPRAQCPQWKAFMREVLPDSKVRLFVQKSAGLALTGLLIKLIIFLYGKGDNGKSVFLDCICATLGDYAGRAASQLLYRNPERTETTAREGRTLRKAAHGWKRSPGRRGT